MARILCKLISTDSHHDAIDLPHLCSIFVGRTPDTKITDTTVSRKQVKLIADCTTSEVTVKQLGTNSSRLNETVLKKGCIGLLKEGGLLEILKGKYPHHVVFTSVNSENSSLPILPSKISKKVKRSHESSDEEITPRKRQKNVNHSEESEDDEEMAEVKRKLQQMKNTLMQSDPARHDHPQQSVNAPDNKSSGIDNSASGPPATTSKWDKPDDKIYVFTSKGVQSKNKIAGFDIDGTIICTKSGKVFPSDTGDWRILYPEIPGKLKKLHSSGYKIIFFTNQKGIEKGKVKIDDFKQKVQNIISKMGIPIQVFISTGSGSYRKPGLGMWNCLINSYNNGILLDKSQCLYVGDAAGRPEKWIPGKKKDFSCSDRLFALNVGVKFYTPEEYFQNGKVAPFNMPEFDPSKLDPHGPLLQPSSAKVTSLTQEVIVMVGFPASGKTHFSKEYLIPKGYIHVSRDNLKTWQKCVEMTKNALGKGKSVVVDNTNPDVDSRKRYTDVAKKVNVRCRCFVMSSSLQHSKHNERFREMTDKSHQIINDMVMNSYKSKFTEPQLSEGFAEIVKVNAVPSFKDSDQEMLYKQFLLEK